MHCTNMHVRMTYPPNNFSHSSIYMENKCCILKLGDRKRARLLLHQNQINGQGYDRFYTESVRA